MLSKSFALPFAALLLAFRPDHARAKSPGQQTPGNPKQVVLISDVDDTIKATGVTVGKTHLKNIPWLLLDPLRPWRPVAGMAELYRALQGRLGAQVFYVSKGPSFNRDRLCRALLRYGFPEDRIYLNPRFPLAPKDYKFQVIAPIIADAPERRYILIGDSGELDPENYGMLARCFPRQVVHVFVRSVTADPESRYRAAFCEVPRSKWEVFAGPEDLRIGSLARSAR